MQQRSRDCGSIPWKYTPPSSKQHKKNPTPPEAHPKDCGWENLYHKPKMKKCLPPPQVTCPASEGQSHGNGTASSRPWGCRRRAHSAGQPPPSLRQGRDAEMLVPSPRPRTRVQLLPSPTGNSSPWDIGPRLLIPSPSTQGPYPPLGVATAQTARGRGGEEGPPLRPRLHLDDREGPRGSVRGAGRGARRGPAMPPSGPGTGRWCHRRDSGAPGGAHARGKGCVEGWWG